jgi:hypothetical protein
MMPFQLRRLYNVEWDRRMIMKDERVEPEGFKKAVVAGST